MSYRITVDTGGTFTDVVVSDGSGRFFVGKALTTPERSFDGIRSALAVAAEEMRTHVGSILSDTELLIFGTTRATNAIVTRATAKTAFLTTEGFPDILVLKEGGKFDAHDFSIPYPEPYIARRHTYEIPERIDAEGGVVAPLDDDVTRSILHDVAKEGFEAVAVCLIWSIANPEHELALGRLIEEELGETPYTLSHQLIPILREYRRASTTAIDASLKPLMRGYLNQMESDLRNAGFTGELLVSTSVGGCMHVAEISERPIHSVKSGPAMAPVAGRIYAETENVGANLIVCDSGGTTFDVGLVRDNRLVKTRDTWLGRQWVGDLISMSTVDVRSVGAGGGSIAWVDAGGLLRVGPNSAGSIPGPACYGRGGTEPTVTDAAIVLKYFDPEFFVGGRMPIDSDAAATAIQGLAQKIDKSPEDTAFGILTIANELMIRAIQEITISEGIDPRESTIIAGGGAAGLNILPIAQELGCNRVLLPETASALSACGMQFAQIIKEESANLVTRSDAFDSEGVARTLTRLRDILDTFSTPMAKAKDQDVTISFSAEARYEFQVWDLEIPIPGEALSGSVDVKTLVEEFHRAHERVFAVRDTSSVVEFLNWKARLSIDLPRNLPLSRDIASTSLPPSSRRNAYFGSGNWIDTPIYRGQELPAGSRIEGPAVIEIPTTTIVVSPGMTAEITATGNFLLQDRLDAENLQDIAV